MEESHTVSRLSTGKIFKSLMEPQQQGRGETCLDHFRTHPVLVKLEIASGSEN